MNPKKVTIKITKVRDNCVEYCTLVEYESGGSSCTYGKAMVDEVIVAFPVHNWDENMPFEGPEEPQDA